jgi:PAS domain S-box-containing protein
MEFERTGDPGPEGEAEPAPASNVQEGTMLRALMEHLPDRIYFKDLHSRFICGSVSFVRMFNREALVDIQGKSDFDFFSEEHAWAAFDNEQEIIRTGQAKLNMEEKETWPDGRITWCCTSKAPLRDDQGRIIGTFGISQDTTAWKASQDALRASEAFLETLINAIPVPVYYKDRDGRYLGFNKAYEAFFGVTQDGLLGKTLLDIRERGMAEQLRGHDVELLETGGTQQLGVKVEIPPGDLRDVIFNKAVFTDGQGKVAGLIGTVQDLTEIRKLENQLHHSQKMEAIGTLAGGVAHDFNNILTAIIGFASLTRMKMQPDDPNLWAIDQILACSERAGQLTRSLLAFSRKQPISPKPVNLDSIILDVEKLLRRLIGENIELTTRLETPGFIILADAGQIGQVLINLVTNARDAMPAGGAIEIATRQTELDLAFVRAHGFGNPGRYALITISDNGSGMDKATQAKIFEPFFTTKEPGRGTGLGLAIVYAMVKQHKGFILVYSEPGLGTTFKLFLPQADPLQQDLLAVPVAALRGGTETILIAEDDPDVRSLTQKVLEDFGYRIIAAADGEEAIRQFQAQADAIQLILVDMVMPKQGGAEVYRAAKAFKPGIRAIFTSGYMASNLPAGSSLQEGLNYLPKPTSPIELLNKVREVLDAE